MKYAKLAFGLLLVSACVADAQAPSPATAARGVTLAPHPLTSYAPVTDEVLRNPNPNDWIMVRGNYEGYGFSSLKQIEKSNVKNLQLVWARTMETGVNEGAPLVHDGVMFLPNPDDVVQAIDAASGELLWQYRRSLPSQDKFLSHYWGQRKRSVFLYKDRIYLVTKDNFVMALDAKTGKEVWQTDRGGDLYITNTSGPIVVNGVVIAGSNCQDAPMTCYVTGHDAESGKELWRNYVVPKKGEPGDETWAGVPFEKRWMTGVWGPITYDPQLNLVYYGSSGVGPASEAQRGMIGATMAGTNTRYAVDPKTGKIAWKHQVLPSDNWDLECTFEMLPMTLDVNPDPKAEGMMAVGKVGATKTRRTLTGVPCKLGVMWSFDAAKGDFLWAKSTIYQNVVKGIDAKGKVTVDESQLMRDLKKTYFHCPPHAGGRDWPFTAYSPEHKVLYVMLQNMCAEYRVRADNIPSKPADQYNTIGPMVLAPGKSNIGRIDAISVETGKTMWSWETPASNYSSILATAGGIIFNGDMARNFRALDQASGKVLWETRLGSQVEATPVTFSVKGRQYVAIAAGGGYNAGPLRIRPDIDQATGSNMLYVFALPQ
jgi:alcohol dehydrogenase (cytochrome c)